MENEFNELEQIKPFSWEDYIQDSFKRKIIEGWVENLVMSALDITKVILASEKREIPQTYKDTLKIFGALYVDPALGDKFSEFASPSGISWFMNMWISSGSESKTSLTKLRSSTPFLSKR